MPSSASIPTTLFGSIKHDFNAWKEGTQSAARSVVRKFAGDILRKEKDAMDEKWGEKGLAAPKRNPTSDTIGGFAKRLSDLNGLGRAFEKDCDERVKKQLEKVSIKPGPVRDEASGGAGGAAATKKRPLAGEHEEQQGTRAAEDSTAGGGRDEEEIPTTTAGDLGGKAGCLGTVAAKRGWVGTSGGGGGGASSTTHDAPNTKKCKGKSTTIVGFLSR